MSITERKSDGSAGAIFSEDRSHRLILWRRWDGKSDTGIPKSCKLITWIMLAPPKADAWEDYPALEKCIGFTKDLGFEGLLVVNLFSACASDPRHLIPMNGGRTTKDTDKYIRKAVMGATRIIVAWGSSGPQTDRCVKVLEIINRKRRAPLSCLGMTSTDEPKHPLYVKKTTKLVPFTGCGHTGGDE